MKEQGRKNDVSSHLESVFGLLDFPCYGYHFRSNVVQFSSLWDTDSGVARACVFTGTIIDEPTPIAAL